MSTQPLLIKVPPSPCNISPPPETTDDLQLENWVATHDGGFKLTCDNDKTFYINSPVKSRSTILKRTSRRILVQYFVNHCENTACTFGYGHAGLCSHQIVVGTRGGRATRRQVRQTLDPRLQCGERVIMRFDLNDSDSE